jgi:DNA polymerase-3 subunit beta
MNIIINRQSLLDAMTVAKSVIPSRSPKPILQCVKLAAKKDALILSATDLSLSIEYRIDAVQVHKPGELLLDADRLHAITRESSDETLELSVNGDLAIVKGSDSQFKLHTQPASDFPLLEFSKDRKFEINGNALGEMVRMVENAVATTDSRYTAQGIFIEGKDGTANFVATNGKRLAIANVASKLDVSAIVNPQALNLVVKLAGDNPVGFGIKDNRITLHTPNAKVSSVLMEGTFPPYADVIPEDLDRKATLATADFLSAIRRAALLVSDERPSVKMHFTKKGLVVESSNPDAGEATINFPCKFEGEEIEIAFNPRYLIDALRVVKSDEVTLGLCAPNRPGVVRAPDYTYVLMPVNLL